MSRSAEGFGVIENRISSDTYSLNESFNIRSGLAEIKKEEADLSLEIQFNADPRERI